MSLSPSNPFGELPDSPISPQGEFVRAELASPGAPDPGERLTILHLMVWTAGSAVMLAFYRQSISQAQSGPADAMNPPWLQAVLGLLTCPLQGAGVAAVMLMLWRKFKGGRSFPAQPGHWLLVIAGVIALASWPLYLATHMVPHHGMGLYLAFYRLPLLVLFCILASYAVSTMYVETRWRGMFLIWIMSTIAAFLSVCAMYFGLFGYRWGGLVEVFLIGGANFAFLVPALLDINRGAKRDNLHWAGVVCRIAYIGLPVLSIVRMFLRQS
ncbi:MAG: hypothetical protein ACKVP0_07295 [Pirellulaceae bacterium]